MKGWTVMELKWPFLNKQRKMSDNDNSQRNGWGQFLMIILKQANQRVLAFHTDIRWEVLQFEDDGDQDFINIFLLVFLLFLFLTSVLMIARIYDSIDPISITSLFPIFRELSEKYRIFQGTSSKSCCRWRKFVPDWLSNFFTSTTSKLQQSLLWRKVDRMHKYFLIFFHLFNILAFFSQWLKLNFWLLQKFYEFSPNIKTF